MAALLRSAPFHQTASISVQCLPPTSPSCQTGGFRGQGDGIGYADVVATMFQPISTNILHVSHYEAVLTRPTVLLEYTLC